MSYSGRTGKISSAILVTAVFVVICQWYPKYLFFKHTGFSLPSLSVAIKWSSGLEDFYAVFLTTPDTAREFIKRAYRGEGWRNDTLDVKLSPTHGNVPFFDLIGDELTNSDEDRWFHTNIRKLDSRRYLHRGYAVIVYPDKGQIYITAGD